MEETTTRYKPELAVKRDRHYKAKYIHARNAVIMLLVLFVLMALVVCWVLHGNNTLQQRLNNSKTVVIHPNGILTSR